MKTVLVVLALVCCVVADNRSPLTEQQMKAIHNECLMQHIRSHSTDESDIVLCKLTNMGLYSESDGYNVDRLVEEFNYGNDVDQAKKSAKDCIAKLDKSDERHGRNYNVIQCFLITQAPNSIKISA